jgi:hypothetical protein
MELFYIFVSMTPQEQEEYIHKETNGHTVPEKIRHFYKCMEFGEYIKANIKSPYPKDHVKNEIFAFCIKHLEKIIVEIDSDESATKIIETVFNHKIDNATWQKHTPNG